MNLIDYESRWIQGLYLTMRRFAPKMGVGRVIEAYQIYYGLVREEQLNRLNLSSLKLLTPMYGERYEVLMMGRVDKAVVLTLDDIMNYKEVSK